MTIRHQGSRALVEETLLGSWLGLLVLGGGGRAVMRGIALLTDAPSALSVGGTVTVLAAGAAAGAAGALMHALSRTIATRAARGRTSARLVLFAALLAVVTARGLHGSPAAPALAFWPLVAAYAALLLHALQRRGNRGAAAAPASDRISLPITDSP